MKFNVASLLKEATGAVREYDIDDDVRMDGQTRHVRGHARFDRTPQGVLVRASVAGTMVAQCSRCLKTLTVPVDVAFEEVYLPTHDINTGARIVPEEGEEESYRIDDRHMLDLGEAIAQYWAMAEPMAPLCEEACRGICPQCGAILADGIEHECPRAQADPRWARLAELAADD